MKTLTDFRKTVETGVGSAPDYLPRRGKKKNCKHFLNQERIHGWPKYYEKNRKNKWHSQINQAVQLRYPLDSLTGGESTPDSDFPGG